MWLCSESGMAAGVCFWPLGARCTTGSIRATSQSALREADVRVRCSTTLPAHTVLHCQRHARTPRTNAKPRDEFAGLHRFATCRGFISSRHRDGCRSVVTGYKVALLDISSIDMPSIPGFTLRLDLPGGIQVARLAPRPLSLASVPRLGIILKHSVEGGHRPFASGTPATRGAHNSEKLRQQPDQLLVRKSIPSRIIEVFSVNTFLRSPSSHIGDIGALARPSAFGDSRH